LVASNRVPHIHRFESISGSLRNSIRLAKELILTILFLSNRICILVFELLIFKSTLELFIRDPVLVDGRSPDLLGQGLEPFEVVLLLEDLGEQQVVVVLL